MASFGVGKRRIRKRDGVAGFSQGSSALVVRPQPASQSLQALRQLFQAVWEPGSKATVCLPPQSPLGSLKQPGRRGNDKGTQTLSLHQVMAHGLRGERWRWLRPCWLPLQISLPRPLPTFPVSLQFGVWPQPTAYHHLSSSGLLLQGRGCFPAHLQSPIVPPL